MKETTSWQKEIKKIVRLIYNELELEEILKFSTFKKLAIIGIINWSIALLSLLVF